MYYSMKYESPMGMITVASTENAVVGLWFDGQKYFAYGLTESETCEEQENSTLTEAKRWLDIYFSGKEPDFDLPISLSGTDFQKKVWGILCAIPYGKTMTYGQIAAQLAAEQGAAHMSAQAVGGAVGHNPLSIIVPCHRVVGTNGSLTGYAGGIDRKIKLLALEGVDMSRFFVPKKGTAL